MKLVCKNCLKMSTTFGKPYMNANYEDYRNNKIHVCILAQRNIENLDIMPAWCPLNKLPVEKTYAN